jgi:hypothetical protein
MNMSHFFWKTALQIVCNVEFFDPNNAYTSFIHTNRSVKEKNLTSVALKFGLIRAKTEHGKQTMSKSVGPAVFVK